MENCFVYKKEKQIRYMIKTFFLEDQNKYEIIYAEYKTNQIYFYKFHLYQKYFLLTKRYTTS
jgi:hypothetical protein